MPSASGVRVTSAPSARMIVTFSSEKRSGTNKRDFVAALHPDQRQADAGIAGCGLDDRATRPELTVRFGPPNHAAGGAIFYAASGIQVFQFGVDTCGIFRNQSFQLQDGSIADELGNVVGDAQALSFDAFCLHPTGYGSRSGASIGKAAR